MPVQPSTSIPTPKLHTRLFPPSPNWNAPKAISVSPPILAYASRDLVILLHSDTFEYIGCLAGHGDRINAVELSERYCASGGSDNTIRCWEVETRKQVGYVSGFKNEVLSLAWTTNKEFVIAGDKSGEIVAWDTKTNKYSISVIVASPVYCIAASPTVKDVVAIGYQNGSIVILKYDSSLQNQILYQLQGHDSEIQSLSWQQASPTSTSAMCTPCNPSSFTYLISGSKDRTVRIWNVPEERTVRLIELPKPKQRLTEQQKNRLWLASVWVPGSWKIITSSYMGYLYEWDVDASNSSSLSFVGGHNRSVFAIVAYPCGTRAVTISMDRQLIIWHLQTHRPHQSILCLGSYVYELDVSVPDPTKLAIALGDNTIRVWNYSHPSDLFSSIMLWKGLKGKITSLKWHPTQEGVLAFGTDMGSVGVFDVYNEKHKLFKSHHRGKVYAIQWGEKKWIERETGVGRAENEMEEDGELDGEGSNRGKKEERRSKGSEPGDMVIFSVGADGVCLMSDLKKAIKASVDLREIIEEANAEWTETLKSNPTELPKRSEVSIHPRGKFIAMGNTNGTIQVFELPSFRMIYQFNGHRQTVNRICWCDNVPGTSNFRGPILASGADDGKIAIHDLFDLDKLHSTISIPTSSPALVLKSHKRGISGLAWSHASKLLSSSFDGTAIVWDITTALPVSIFRGYHQGRLFSCAWSPIDEDLVFTGGDDQMCFAWKPSEHPYTEISEKSSTPAQATFSPAETSITPAPTLKSPAKREATTKKNESRHKRQKKVNLFPSSSLGVSRKKIQKDIFELSKNIYNGDIEKALAVWNENGPDKARGKGKTKEGEKIMENEGAENRKEEKRSYFTDLVAGDKKDVKRLVTEEVSANNTLGLSMSIGGLEINRSLPLDLWLNNIPALIERLDKNEGLSSQDWIILALSPLAGRDVWQSLLQKQAQKLLAKGEHHAAVMCLIACGEIYEAINVYKQADMYREALTLAKIRLPQDDPIIFDLHSDWALQLEKEPSYEQAAMCYIASQKPAAIPNALNAVARAGDVSGLCMSASLALLLGDSSAEERLTRYKQEQEVSGKTRSL